MIQSVVECPIVLSQKIAQMGLMMTGTTWSTVMILVNMNVETLKAIVKMVPMMMEMVPSTVMMMIVAGLHNVAVLGENCLRRNRQ